MRKHILFLAALSYSLSALNIVAAPVVWNFDNETEGQLPKGWMTKVCTPSTATPVYKIVSGTPGATGKTLSLATADFGGLVTGTYTATYTDSIKAADVEISVKFRNDGGLNNTGGLCWRVKDKDNYYCARASTQENNIGLYWVEGGKRTTISQGANGSTTVTGGVWHTLKIVQSGASVSVSLDNVVIIQPINDTHIQGVGSVGVWQKGIGAVSFDDFSVTNNDAGTAIRPKAYSKLKNDAISTLTASLVTLTGRTLPKTGNSNLASGLFFETQASHK
jgi:hypothetical protein